MSVILNTDGLAAEVAVQKPTVVGAAVRIFLLGGSALSEKQRDQASGSSYLMRQNGEAIMDLVAVLESRAS
jgi:hypothetical protein